MSLQDHRPLAELAVQAASHLRSAFQREPEVTSAAPGRVNLIGEHIDYCDGFVLPFAIDRYVVIAAAPNGSREAHVGSGSEEIVTFDLSKQKEPGLPKWANYLRGVIRGFQDRGHEIPGFDAWIVSSVPSGAGLSSSAALECATATLLEGLLHTDLDNRDKALLCQKAEHDFAGVPCGIMDQFASVFGAENHLVLIDCHSAETSLVPFDNPEITVLISNTHADHSLDDGGYGNRRGETERALEIIGESSWRSVSDADLQAALSRLTAPLDRRARHVVTEIDRTREAARSLENHDFSSLGKLMDASHRSLRDDFEVSCRELDLLVDIAGSLGPANGVYGARMTGGGFGGSTVTLCESARAADIAQTLASEYRDATGIDPEIFHSRPARGAHLLGS